ncbi:MAG: hypothetical protein KC731_16435 [Myxococcales bacterium]|nr:hypothetical protein [Myxococcales bacterium]
MKQLPRLADEEGSCGTKSAGNCYCDDLCAGLGDCCSDYEAVCLADHDDA